MEVNVFFLPSFNMWKEEEGKGVSLNLDFVFSLWSG